MIVNLKDELHKNISMNKNILENDQSSLLTIDEKGEFHLYECVYL